jgi:hypothetical protein
VKKIDQEKTVEAKLGKSEPKSWENKTKFFADLFYIT